MKIVVVGAGLAGTAAAWAARRRGFDVHVVADGSGATGLYSGVLDGTAVDADIAVELREFEQALAVWREPPGHVATSQGVVRVASRVDRALLELDALRGRSICVADVARDDWDADLLAQAFSASDWAKKTATTFVPCPVTGLQHGYERRIPLFDFAQLHDAPARTAWFAAQLTKANPGAAGWLCGPWLGAAASQAAQLAQLTGVPVGEVTSPPGAAAGARFEAAREALFRAHGISTEVGYVESVATSAPENTSAVTLRWRPQTVEPPSLRDAAAATAEPSSQTLRADVVVLATGGVVGGGLNLVPRDSQHQRGPFRASVNGAWHFHLDGKPVEDEASLFGLDFTRLGVGVLERTGFACDPDGQASPRVYVVGHARADVLKGGLDAVCSALRSVRAIALLSAALGLVLGLGSVTRVCQVAACSKLQRVPSCSLLQATVRSNHELT